MNCTPHIKFIHLKCSVLWYLVLSTHAWETLLYFVYLLFNLLWVTTRIIIHVIISCWLPLFRIFLGFIHVVVRSILFVDKLRSAVWCILFYLFIWMDNWLMLLQNLCINFCMSIVFIFLGYISGSISAILEDNYNILKNYWFSWLAVILHSLISSAWRFQFYYILTNTSYCLPFLVYLLLLDCWGYEVVSCGFNLRFCNSQ